MDCQAWAIPRPESGPLMGRIIHLIVLGWHCCLSSLSSPGTRWSWYQTASSPCVYIRSGPHTSIQKRELYICEVEEKEPSHLLSFNCFFLTHFHSDVQMTDSSHKLFLLLWSQTSCWRPTGSCCGSAARLFRADFTSLSLCKVSLTVI